MIIGVDAGGTTTRSLLAGPSGTRLREARTGGANPVTRGVQVAVDAVEHAVTSVAGERLGDVHAVVIALAGLEAGGGDVVDRLRSKLSSAGLPCTPLFVPDSLAVLAAATTSTQGTVLVSGTGAVAVHVVDGQIARVADGHGWLLGDRGSGQWIGSEAVRATLRSLDQNVPSALATAVLNVLAHGPEPRHALMAAVYADPLRMASLAPVVLELAEREDPAAAHILRRAVGHLRATVRAARPADSAGPIAVTGGIATSPTVALPLLEGIAHDWPGAEAMSVPDAAAGAAWLALQSCGSPTAEIHARLTATG